MKILFFGDSITEGRRERASQNSTVAPYGLGTGYVNPIASELIYNNPEKYKITNTGISGNRIVDMFQRIKVDCWNYEPDVISILCGVNDVWHELDFTNGVSPERYERIYRMMIEDTLQALPNAKIMILEPFIKEGPATKGRWEQFQIVYEYAKISKKIAEEFNLPFVPLQAKLDEYADKHGADLTFIDGVHPSVAGARVIANEWLKVFKEKIDK